METGGSFLTRKPGRRLVASAAMAAAAALLAPSTARASFTENVAVHGFASQGAALAMRNDFAGVTDDLSFDFTEAAVTVSALLDDRLRVGMQLLTMKLGDIGDFQTRLDWGYFEYAVCDWVRLRFGRIKVPLGLYTEIIDIDAARTPILMPQPFYDVGLRLNAFNGASLSGTFDLGPAGSLDYQIYAGKFEADVFGVINVQVKKGIGGRLEYMPPVEGLRIGYSHLYGSYSADQVVDAATAEILRTYQIIEPDASSVLVLYEDVSIQYVSLEYEAHDILLAAEYARWSGDARSRLREIGMQPNDLMWDRWYLLAGYRLSEQLLASVYYTERYDDFSDRKGNTITHAHDAWQKDLTATLRFDVTPNWIIKLEGHRIDGTAGLAFYDVKIPETKYKRLWGLLLAKTTVFF